MLTTARLPIRTVGDVRLTALAGSVIESYQLKSLVAFAEKKHLNLPEKLIKFVKVRKYSLPIRPLGSMLSDAPQDPEDGRIRLKMLDAVRCCSGNDTSCCVGREKNTIFPLDRAYDSVFLCTGYQFDATLFREPPQMQRFADGQRHHTCLTCLRLRMVVMDKSALCWLAWRAVGEAFPDAPARLDKDDERGFTSKFPALSGGNRLLLYH